MSAKESFIVLLRIVFVAASLQFVGDVFYYWDGYSYYMRFADFVPELSLLYLLYSVSWIMFAFIIWLIVYGLTRIVNRYFLAVGIEYSIMWVILCVLILAMRQILFRSISLSESTGLNHIEIIVIGSFLVTAAVLLTRKYIMKILSGIDNRITPLVWLFAFLMILAVPSSMIRKGFTEIKSESHNYSHIASSGKNRPNIILVIMDALSAEDMQLYGYHRPTTPFISKWAETTILFNKAYSSSNWTTPAMMSMLTGQRPWTHRLWYYAYYNPASNNVKNILAVLNDSGYGVYSFVQNPYAHPEVLGIEDGLLAKDKSHTFWIPSGWWAEKIGLFFLSINRPIVAELVFKIRPFNRLLLTAQPSIYTTLKPSEAVYNRFLDKIPQGQRGGAYNAGNLETPFFAWLHVWPPHEAYLPPKPYMGLFGDAERFNTVQKQEERGFEHEYKPEQQETVDLMRKRYDEFILYSDKQFELFMSRLSKSFDMSNTIVILTSDHGEMFSKGYMQHGGPHMYEPLVHVPLIIKMPGQTSGKTINIPVEQIDIAPTILELSGIKVPDWMEGRSLVPLIVDSEQSHDVRPIEPRPVFSMNLIKNRSFGHPITKGTIAVWHKGYKLIYYLDDKKTLLFDISSDPAETKNLSEDKPGISQHLMKLIDDRLSRANAKIRLSHEK